MPRTLTQLTEEIVSTFESYTTTGTNRWTWETAIRDLPYQLGSLAKAGMMLSGDRHAAGQSREQILATVRDELADIMAEVLFIAHDLEINLEEAWDAMLKSDAEKIQARTANG